MLSKCCSCCIKSWRNWKFFQRIPTAEPFIINHNRRGRNYILRKDDSKRFEKNSPKTNKNEKNVKKWKYTGPIIQNTTEIMKNKFFYWFQTEKDGNILQ